MPGSTARSRAASKAPEPVKGPYWQQRGWQAAAAFLALAVVGAVLAAFSGGAGAPARGESVDLGSSQPLVRAAGAGGGAGPVRRDGCRTDDTATKLPGAPPRDVSWRQLAGDSVPTSASAGPTLAGGPVWWCFARTPMGAVMAAHVIPTQMSGGAWRSVVEEQVVPGRSRDFLVSLRSAADGRRAGDGPRSSYAGYAVNDYSPTEARVRLLLRAGGGTSLYSTEVVLRWHDGDWKAVAQPDGSLFSDLAPTANGGSFELWRL
ncbi:hypothetical protein [Streptomyces capillispiralis]|uniref:DUF8175 domain-containing protein n=1 Tax=Streptomyces capillispiralis TaxID=68182 RepID=A0A561SGV4_9ACTN|nr:hypothetical protein [Streptomyces capillispiralis]TWF74095.1 hypothetical protein FHX78_12127 [Streptomyces capillispiralis]GHE24279.1 hypothetical protein GCM10017779_71910 [Streptomyces capillispiralis]